MRTDPPDRAASNCRYRLPIGCGVIQTSDNHQASKLAQFTRGTVMAGCRGGEAQGDSYHGGAVVVY